MRLLLILTFILLFTSCKTTKQSFTGSIKFSTQILPSGKTTKDLTILKEIYGDSMIMIYKKNGDFTRTYLNNINSDQHSQSYDAYSGKLFIKNKDLETIDSLDTTINGLTLKSRKKIDNELIMNYDCECYEYITFNDNINQEVILNFCFSPETPYLNYNLFKKHKDFFLSDFYEKTNRPYLKFSMKTEEYKLIYTASSIKTN